MTQEHDDAFRDRIERLRDRVDIAGVISKVVTLGRGEKPRGKCPFHGSKSDSFAVDKKKGRAICWGCNWTGDAIKFVMDYYGRAFMDAVELLESDHGLDGQTAAPVHREKQAAPRREREAVDSLTMGRWIWKHVAIVDPAKVRIYFIGRGVPAELLSDDRLANIRFAKAAPIVAWEEGRSPRKVPQAPAIVALVRRPPDWTPCGVHVTYLEASLAAKMDRARQDGSKYPARKMLGPVGGGAVLYPGAGSSADAIAFDAPLFVGEGNETVLSGMAIAGADATACGVATLSLDNLQGRPLMRRQALPLYDPQPDPDGRPLAFRHGGAVVGLIDADMKPLRGPLDPLSGFHRGMPVIERKGGPVVHRTISSAERTAVCGALFTQAWRAAGSRARSVRPRMGQDFNDAVRGRT
ncbi:CHC2 zinc finger domain-containing protein [Sphingomonas sp. SRS2]|uniref:CHC2 zinc finger domain-containing protein n=1 Tax=Sphingomonas sp. SRS2 TaxID=133190 RepID=UPI00061840BD|nr:CHC2 zinc finger domain-containing protein [Sphingomonas sp. SRS2]KKC24920.1 DNA primase [Sphingomonas sp. SRS2]